MGKHKQRVSEKDAQALLSKIKKNDQNQTLPPCEFIEDYAGGSEEYIRRDIVDILIQKLTK